MPASLTRTRPVLRALPLLVALALGGCSFLPVEEEPMPPPVVIPEREVDTQVVERGSIVKILTVRGMVRAAREEILRFPTAGILEEIAAASGEEATAGQVLVRLATDDLPRQLRDLRYEIRRAELELAAFDADPNRGGQLQQPEAGGLPPHLAAQREALLLRIQELVTQQQAVQSRLAESPNDPEAQAQLRRLQSERRRAELDLEAFDADPSRGGLGKTGLPSHLALQRELLVLRLEQLQEQYQDLQELQDQTVIRAPMDGLVSSIIDARVGESVARGEVAATVADPSTLHVVVENNDGRLRLLAKGQPVQVYHPYNQGLPPLQGTIESAPLVAEDLVSAEGVVRLDLTETLADSSYRIGDYVQVRVEIARANNALKVPNRAVGIRGSEHYLVVQEEGSFREVPVTIGIASDEETQILSGVEEGQVVRLLR